MTELIRRLDRSRFGVHVACFRRAGRLAAARRGARRSPRFRSAASRGPATLAARCVVRALVPRATASRWCRPATSTRTPSACPARRWPACRCASAAAASSIPTRRAAQIALQRAGLSLRARASSRTRAPRHGSSSRKAPGGSRPRSFPTASTSDRFAARRSAQPRRSRPVITVANLRPEKAHDVLLAAAAHAAAASPKLQFLIVGDGPRAAELRALAADARASQRAGRVPRASRRRRRRCWRRPTRSCCRRAPRRFPTARSKRWPRACRSWPAASAGCSI